MSGAETRVSLLSLPAEILTEVALLLPRPVDVRHFSAASRRLWQGLGRANRILWWQVRQDMRRHADVWDDFEPSPFSEGVDYWQQVTDILVPKDGMPKGCFQCYMEAPDVCCNMVSIGGKFYRALCTECFTEDFWAVDELPKLYLNITPRPDIIATVSVNYVINPDDAFDVELFGLYSHSMSAICPYEWVHRQDIEAEARTQFPPEEITKRSIFLSRWAYYYEEHSFPQPRSVFRSNPDSIYTKSQTKDFHMGVGEKVFLFIERILSIYTFEYRAFHVVKSPQAFYEFLVECMLKEYSEAGNYQTRLDWQLMHHLDMGANILGSAVAKQVTAVTKQATAAPEDELWSGMIYHAESGMLMRNHLGDACLSEHKLATNINMIYNPYLVYTWLGTYVRKRFKRRKIKKIDSTHRRDVYCSFCDAVFYGPNCPDFTAWQLEEKLARHIFENHHENFSKSWNKNGDSRLPTSVFSFALVLPVHHA
ncbi:hypothetical protein H072_2906 [Dactylellina haptotyla CBS 200.50]|uniref:F-box domain-containing protein n=1 Tax=Dactylellina haptotyla (strain CBS 200.50) TaxID=1284197 RepID=S8APU6_DACHA|nr:hypothetical protein H072_2906 [Dactylellina haptotyla CBS 200.50]